MEMVNSSMKMGRCILANTRMMKRMVKAVISFQMVIDLKELTTMEREREREHSASVMALLI